MSILTILTYPDKKLREKAKPVTDFGPELEALAADMAETMYKAPGVGLAATQVGEAKQLLVFDISSADDKGEYTALVNPKILECKGEEAGEEGCLSVREYCAQVKRATWIKVEACDIHGNPLSFEAEDFLARVLQHEIDHLNGKLFIDRLSSLKRTLYKKKLKKLLQADKEEE